MSEKLKQYYNSLEDNFFGRWLKNFRISVMLTILLIGYGLYAAFAIPKESSPEIKFGLVSVSTVYPGANPVDIDSLITTKLEEKIENINGIDGINSVSAVGLSNITITLKNETDTKDFINDLKAEIDKVSLPTDAKDPIVTEISTANEILFELMLYAPSKNFSMNHLRTLAYEVADNLRGQGPIVDAKIGSVGGGRSNAGGGTTDNQFDIQVLIDEKKMQQLGLTLGQISQSIRNFNSNIPLGNHELGNLNYDYRIKGKLESIQDLMQVPINLGSANGAIEYIRLSDIALIQRNYKDESIQYGGSYDKNNNVATKIVIYKANRSNVFTNAKIARELISKELSKPQYKGISIDYTSDLADIISEDYKSLASNAQQSVVLIFLVMRLFVGFKQSLIATIAMPLSFMITFIYLNTYGYTLNFLTNFSLVLSFGMGIDTVVVIIEAAYELMKKGFSSKTAVLLALKQYAKPNITSSLANMMVFLPMLSLPGITGKFLAYIPITIFVTLLASLFLSLSLNNALFRKINNNQKWYYKDKEYDEGEDEEILLSAEDQELLALERSEKEVRNPDSQPRVDRKIAAIAHRYSTKLHITLESLSLRRQAYRGPVVLLILSFIFLSPRIGFKLFPSGDNEFMNIGITSKIGSTTDSLKPLLGNIDQIISSLPEVRNYTLEANGNSINISVRTVKKSDRKRNSFEIEDEINDKLAYLKELGYTVESKVQAGGPPTGKAVGIKLIAEETRLLNDLKRVSIDFEQYLKSLQGTINVSNSSKNNPGQFEFTRDRNKLAELGLTPSDFQGELLSALLGSNVGTISIDKKDRDIIVQYKGYEDNLNPESLLSTMINTRVGPVMLGSVAEYSINQSLSTLSRVDGDITISVESDLDVGLKPTDFQPKLESFASSYQFPSGVSFKAGGENEANTELIQAAGVAFVIAIFLTFLILIYQFNSFTQSLIILYSIVTALLGVNIGLFITGNPYSMPFMIGFISLIGIVVNNAIFIIDKINSNIALGASLTDAIIDAGKTRFKPVVISSLTTILGIITLARKDEFRAGLAYTVVFGLLFSSFMTLIAIPNIYYSVYKKK